MTNFANIRLVLTIVLYLNMLRCFECTEYSVRVTKYGRVKGIVVEVHGQKKVEKFFGIPYASPPIGKLRFEITICLVISIKEIFRVYTRTSYVQVS
ncbi:postsynaptic membrane assembly [Mactra antiquata]